MRKKNKDRGTSLKIEQFENREMLAADFLEALIPEASIDGTGNNEENENLGSTDEQLIRLTTAEYSDGFNSAAGENLASARAISNAINAQTESIVNQQNLTDMLWLFGQFLDHDISITENADPAEELNIEVPTGDIYFDPFGTGTQVITFNRSVFEGGTSTDDLREQINQITAFIDGSVIYGSSVERMNALREFEGGRMLTSEGDLLPFNESGLANAGGTSNSLFLAGDVRSNENIALIAMHTIWVREHNRIAGELESANADLTDEEIFQTARAIVRAELQAITFNEFLPAILGEGAIERYSGYDPTVDPSIANEFSTAAYRFGHTMLSSQLLRLNADGTEADEGNIELLNAFFSPSQISEFGIDSILQGVAAQEAQEIDTQVVDDIRNFLFGPPGSGGFDLASLNIQRGRDHGIADYNQVREELGLSPITSFADITYDEILQDKLRQVYGSVDNIDLWIGGLAEDHVPGAAMGETFSTIIADQFSRLRDGDRFWYQNLFEGDLLQQIESSSLADVIERNSGVANLQENVFFSASAQPEFDRIQPLVINLPKSNEPIHVIVKDGRIDVRTAGKSESTLLLSDTKLVIRGTGRADNINLDLRDDSVLQLSRIVVNAGGGDDRVRIIGVNAEFDGQIRVNGQRGNDNLRAMDVNAAVEIFGGAGHDILEGGNRSDKLFGGGGRDRIMGGNGRDQMQGGRGNDMMDGQRGDDRMIEMLAADTVLNNEMVRNQSSEVDRIFEMESALFIDIRTGFDVDTRGFRGDVEIRRRG